MTKSPSEFRSDFLEFCLDFLWRQWSQIGVGGYSGASDEWVIDPEALLLLSCSMARYEVRLFDEILDWLMKNGDSININRLKSIMKTYPFSGEKVLSALASFMAKQGKQKKWRTLASKDNTASTPRNLFIRKNGKSLRVFGEPNAEFAESGFLRNEFELRGYSSYPKSTRNSAFIFMLRNLIGVNARCEILLYLICHERAHPSRLARDTHYYQKTVQDALVEMSRSGLIHVHSSGREKHYWLNREDWLNLLHDHKRPNPVWLDWPPLFSSLDQLWSLIAKDRFANLQPMIQCSELRSIMRKCKPLLEKNECGHVFSEERLYPGEEYAEIWLQNINDFFKRLGWQPEKKDKGEGKNA